jgi:hypothetical protein
MKYTLLFFILLTNAFTSYAQIKRIKEKSMVTNKNMTVTIVGEQKKDFQTPTRTRYTSLYRRDAKKLLLGNPCAEDVMASYGFRYEIVPKNHDMSGSRYFFHNFFADIKLFFNNGPFWKARAQKKIEKCRRATGDFVD